jgi:tryptophan synthase beta subunit
VGFGIEDCLAPQRKNVYRLKMVGAERYADRQGGGTLAG